MVEKRAGVIAYMLDCEFLNTLNSSYHITLLPDLKCTQKSKKGGISEHRMEYAFLVTSVWLEGIRVDV
jgi:hypothetical protein